MPEGDQGYHSMAYRILVEVLFEHPVVELLKFGIVPSKSGVERIRRSIADLRELWIPITRSEGAIPPLELIKAGVVKELLFFLLMGVLCRLSC
jgi:hypothetical protein